MLRRIVVAAVLAVASTAGVRATTASPPWLSIEAPVNPFDPSVRGAVMLVHAFSRDGVPKAADLSGAAEGLVDGARRSIALKFDETRTPGVFAVRRQWPTDGTWLLRVSFARTTALVMLDRSGTVAAARIPTTVENGVPIPRAVAQREIDSTLAEVAKR